jgi:hypothetical protein
MGRDILYVMAVDGHIEALRTGHLKGLTRLSPGGNSRDSEGTHGRVDWYGLKARRSWLPSRGKPRASAPGWPWRG